MNTFALSWNNKASLCSLNLITTHRAYQLSADKIEYMNAGYLYCMCQITLHESKKFLAYYQYQNEQQLIFHKKKGVKKNILERGFEQLDILMTYYSKVSVILLQLHQSYFTADNNVMTKFVIELKKRIKKKYNCEIGYLWVREQNVAYAQHYHLMVMVNGHKCNNAYTVSNMCEDIWQGPTDTNFAYRVKNRIYCIKRYKNDGQELRATRMRMSYMAKNDTKEFAKYTKSFGRSKLTANIR